MAQHEWVRVRMVRIIFVLYWLLIFGGALRKWGLPQLQQPLFFILVPFTLLLYGISLTERMWPKRIPLLYYALGSASIVLVVPQMLLGGYALRYLVLAGYGWLNYFFYVPLAFIIAKTFDKNDIYRLLRHTLWIGIVSAPLVALQFESSPYSIVNAGQSSNPSNQFLQLASALGHIRPAGFFSSSIGLWMFLGPLAVAVFYSWITTSKTPVARKPVLIMAALALLSMLAFSGSRGAMLQVGLVLTATIVGAVITYRNHLGIGPVVLPVLLLLMLIFLSPIVFPDAYDTFVTRWTEAAAASNFVGGIFGRSLYPLYAWIDYLTGPVFGYLLGMATDASARLPWVHLPAAANAWTGYGIWAREGGWAAHLVDLGLFLGFGYIIFRIWLTFLVMKGVWISMINNRDLLGLMLFSFSGELILMGQITVQGTVNGFAWIFLGVTMAATKLASERGPGKLKGEIRDSLASTTDRSR